MKVLFVKPPMYASKPMLNFISFAPPLGILQLASVLEEDKNEVQIIDCLIEGYTNYEEIDDKIVKIGMSWDKERSSVFVLQYIQ